MYVIGHEAVGRERVMSLNKHNHNENFRRFLIPLRLNC
jgi:hypothetical protein